jgi:hypothetical protein
MFITIMENSEKKIKLPEMRDDKRKVPMWRWLRCSGFGMTAEGGAPRG